jgi:hypothetical protein
MRMNYTKVFAVLFTAAVLVYGYVYAKPGIWPHYRWAGLILGIVWSGISVLVQFRKDRVDVSGLPYAIMMLVLGLTFMFSRGGGVVEGFIASAGIGIALREFYCYYTTRNSTARTS